jgi:hypothetical protein
MASVRITRQKAWEAEAGEERRGGEEGLPLLCAIPGRDRCYQGQLSRHRPCCTVVVKPYHHSASSNCSCVSCLLIFKSDFGFH